MNFFDKVVDVITRPQRFDYNTTVLGPSNFTVKNIRSGGFLKIKRKDFTFLTTEQEKIEVSFYQQTTNQTQCVLYLHANNGCRVQATTYANSILEQQLNLCAFDFVGSGLSSGDYITLGINEAKSTSQLVNYLIQKQNIQKIYLWGRSMGAVTALIYAAQAHSAIKGLVLDSPFQDLRELIKESGSRHTGLPTFCFHPCLHCIDNKFNQRTGFTLDKYNILQYLQSERFVSIPALFIVSETDGMVGSHHGKTLFFNYKCPQKQLLYIEEAHSKRRTPETIKKIVDFLKECVRNNEEILSISSLLSQSQQILNNSCLSYSENTVNSNGKNKISLSSIVSFPASNREKECR